MPSIYRVKFFLLRLGLISFVLSQLFITVVTWAATLENDDFENGLGSWSNVAVGDSHDWTHYSGATSSPNTGPVNGANGSQYYIYLESSGGSANVAGDTAILQSAAFNEIQTAKLTFHYHMYGMDIGKLSMDVLSSGSWVNDVWSLSGAQQSASDAAYDAVELDLSAYTVSQIRFRATAVGGYRGDIALDDITIGSTGHIAPTFKHNPITKSSVTQDQPYASSMLNDVIYGNNGTLTYTKISGPDWLIISADGSLSGTPTGADVGVNHFVVQVSDGVLPDTTTLAIDVRGIQTIFLNDDFENGLGKWKNITTDDSHDWLHHSGLTSSPKTGPAGGSNNSSYYAYLETSGGSANAAGDTAILQSPKFGASNTVNVHFSYHMYGQDTGTLSLDVLSDDTWVNDVWSLSGEQQTASDNGYSDVELDLRAYSVSQLRFRATAAGGYRGDIALDDITVSAVGFVAPSFMNDLVTKANAFQEQPYSDSIAADAADGNGDVLNYRKVSGPDWLNISEDGGLSGIPTIDDIGSNSFVVEVSDGILSDTATLVIVVDGIPVTLFSDSFESGLDNWSNVTDGDTNDWVKHSGVTPSPNTGPINGANDSQQYMYLETSGGGANTAGDTAILQSKVFNHSDSVILAFDYHMYGVETGTLAVDVLSNGVWLNDVWSLSGQQQSATDDSYTAVELDLSAYVISQIRFRATAVGGYRGDIALDDIKILTVGRVAPRFLQDPINKPTLTQDQSFGDSLISHVYDANGDTLSYSKVSGPEWLNVSVLGFLSGTPKNSDVGINQFVVQVSDGQLTNTATLVIPIKDNFIPTHLFNDDFENGTGSWVDATNGKGNWTRQSGTTPSPHTGPTSGANNSQYYLYMETSGGSANTAGDTAILQSSIFPATQTATLTFYYHMYGADTGSLSVDVLSNGGWVNDVWSISGAQQLSSEESYIPVELDLGAHEISQVRLRALAAGGYRGDIAIDSLEITHRVPPDSDADGVDDLSDQCPTTPVGEIVDVNGCAASERDSDGDGITDPKDMFPNDPSNASADHWVHCSPEWSTCRVPFPTIVRYGVAGTDKYTYIHVDSIISCYNDAIENPAPRQGLTKECDYLLSKYRDSDSDGVADFYDKFPADPNETADLDNDGVGDNSDPFPEDPTNRKDNSWIFCASEFDTCIVPIPSLVRYGVYEKEKYRFSTVDSSIACKNQSFDFKKEGAHFTAHCHYLLSDTGDYDGDGVVDSQDALPGNSAETVDSDNDGIGDNSDSVFNLPDASTITVASANIENGRLRINWSRVNSPRYRIIFTAVGVAIDRKSQMVEVAGDLSDSPIEIQQSYLSAPLDVSQTYEIMIEAFDAKNIGYFSPLMMVGE